MFHLLQKLAELIEKKKLQDGLLSVVRTRHALAKWFVFYTEQTVVVLVWFVGGFVKRMHELAMVQPDRPGLSPGSSSFRVRLRAQLSFML